MGTKIYCALGIALFVACGFASDIRPPGAQPGGLVNQVQYKAGVGTFGGLPNSMYPGAAGGQTETSVAVAGIDFNDSSAFVGIGGDGFPAYAVILSGGPPSVALLHCQTFDCTASDLNTIATVANIQNYVSLQIGSDGFPRIIYMTATALHYVRCQDVSCATSPVDTSAVAIAGYEMAFYLGAGNVPTIAYVDYNDGTPRPVHVAVCADQDCSSISSTNSLVPTDTFTAYPLAIVAVSGNPAVLVGSGAFAQAKTLNLFLCSTASCSASSQVSLDTVASGTQGYYYGNLRLGSDGNLRAVSEIPTSVFVLSICGNASCSSHTSTNLLTGSAGNVAFVSFDLNGLVPQILWESDFGQYTYSVCSNAACATHTDTNFTPPTVNGIAFIHPGSNAWGGIVNVDGGSPTLIAFTNLVAIPPAALWTLSGTTNVTLGVAGNVGIGVAPTIAGPPYTGNLDVAGLVRSQTGGFYVTTAATNPYYGYGVLANNFELADTNRYWFTVDTSAKVARFPSDVVVGFTATGGASGSIDSAFSRISAGLIGVGTGAAGSFAGSLKLTDLTVVGTCTGCGGGASPAAPDNSLQRRLNSTTFGGSANLTYAELSASAPTVGQVGAPGANSYGYEAVLRSPLGTTAGSSETSIATGNATLDGTNYNTVTVQACTGSGISVDVWLTSTDTGLTLGFLANVACGATFNHQGQNGQPDPITGNTTPPTTDTGSGSYLNNHSMITGHSAIGGTATPDYYDSISGVGGYSVLTLAESLTDNPLGGATNGLLLDFYLAPSSTGAAVSRLALTTPASNSNNVGLSSVLTTLDHQGSGSVSFSGPTTYFTNQGGGTAVGTGDYINYAQIGGSTTSFYMNAALVTNQSAGTIASLYDYYVYAPQQSGGASITNNFAYYAEDLTAATIGATNSYLLWLDSPGVFRVRGDGIMAYYNPGATAPKYTPGAVDFERVVQQWTSNVAEIGTEAGGTGTFRTQRIIGKTVEIKNNRVASVSTVIFTGSGLDDATSGGTYTGTSDLIYCVKIDTTGTPDKFSWGTAANGATANCTNGATGVSITGSAQTLSTGATITFAATTGHTLADLWTFQAVANGATQLHVVAGSGQATNPGLVLDAAALLNADLALPLQFTKSTQSATAPGAGIANLRWVAGTNSGTCKLVGNAGTSATEVTIVDNVGGGC